MIKTIEEFIKESKLNIYDIAVMSKEGIETVYCTPCNACNESYSIAKLFISSAIGILLDQGMLKLDQKLTDLLREELPAVYDPVWDQVTIRHAMTHRMGIDYGVVDIDRDDIGTYGTDDFLAYIFAYPPKYLPGEYYEYSDVPHYLLSRVISKITGMAADEFINNKIQVPLSFRQYAWSRCPRNYTVGSSGVFLRASDMVKLGWLYLNKGIYEGQRILSDKFVLQAEEEGFELSHIDGSSFVGKAGMLGQMVMYNREKGIAVAWHSYELDKRDRVLVPFLENLISG